MLKIILTYALLCCCTFVIAQSQTKGIDRAHYFRLLEGSEQSGLYRTSLFSDVDSSWTKWQERGYNFGFDTQKTPMYTQIDGIISTPYMI